MFDTDGNGSIDVNEFRQIFSSREIRFNEVEYDHSRRESVYNSMVNLSGSNTGGSMVKGIKSHNRDKVRRSITIHNFISVSENYEIEQFKQLIE
jgi:Ca2+-binding EF-hand superfamily protein